MEVEEFDHEELMATFDAQIPEMTLEQFLAAEGPLFASIQYDTPEGPARGRFRKMRRGDHMCVDIAIVYCWPFGKGIFRQLIEYLQSRSDVCCIYIDSIHSEVLWKCLPRYGFKITPQDQLTMYWCRLRGFQL